MSLAVASRLEAGAGNWRALAACRVFSYELFFSEDEREIELAKVVCRTCPVSRECFEEARANKVSDGIWGGYTAEELHREESQPLWSDSQFYDPVWASLVARQAIVGLQQVALVKKQTPRRDDVRRAAAKGQAPSLKQIQLVFGSWTNCKRILYLVQLRELKHNLSSNPTCLQISQANKGGRCPLDKAFIVNFGSVGRALELIGAQRVRKCPKRGQDRLLREFRQACLKERRILSSYALEGMGAKHGLASRSTYFRYWGRHRDLVQAAFPDGFNAVETAKPG
ncbi:MAG TPA: WhiB family transcriptional regulator [Candidatus Saccharimonadales bacterium]|nr:WhiB family transcriptional regulator [Candidatus Saccharimonadales bacterium]